MGHKKTIMILGGGIFQLEAIRTSVKLGYHVISVDYLPDNIGHKYSHEYLNLSTTDHVAIMKAARQKSIDGIFTMASDVALPTLGFVSNSLGLIGPSLEVIRTLTRKDHFRRLQKQLNLESPFIEVVNESSQDILESRDIPLMIKPAVSSGSRGVVKVTQGAKDLKQRIHEACTFSFDGRACIEEYVSGTDICVEGFIVDERIQFSCFTLKQMRGFAVLGHEIPLNLDAQKKSEMLNQAKTVFEGIGYKSGPFDADFRVSGDRVVLLEITPRLGGNGVPVLCNHATGHNLIEQSIKHSMGEMDEGLDKQLITCATPSVSILLYSEKSGVVSSFNRLKNLNELFDEKLNVVFALQKGQKLSRFRHGGHVFGYCVMSRPPEYTFDCIAEKLLSVMNLKLEELV